MGHVLLIHEVSRSHTTTHHSRYDSSGQVISTSQRPLPGNTQQSQQTDIHDHGGFRTHILSRRAATDLSHRPRGHWDRPIEVAQMPPKLVFYAVNLYRQHSVVLSAQAFTLTGTKENTLPVLICQQIHPSCLCLVKQKQFSDARQFELNYQAEEAFIRWSSSIWRTSEVRADRRPIESEYIILVRTAQRRITITGWVHVDRTGFMLRQLNLCRLNIAI